MSIIYFNKNEKNIILKSSLHDWFASIMMRGRHVICDVYLY